MMKIPKRLFFLMCSVGILLIGLALLSACGSGSATPTEQPTEEPTPEPIPDQSAYFTAWEGGPHGMPWDIGKGPNTMCSRCHSPQNWEPDSRPGAPPNCVTCKFAHQEEMTVAPTLAEGGMDYVGEEDWVGIPCAQCHQVDENGTAGEVAWLAPKSMVYEPILSTNELCYMCHVDSTGNKGSGGNGTDQSITMGGSAHANFAGEWPQSDRPKYCVDCHDPHSGETMMCVDCHTDTNDTHTKVSFMLETVTCMACHDASGSEVGYDTDSGLFTTILTSPGRGGGPPSVSTIISHSIVWLVECDRCHFEDNTWELTVLEADGSVPETEE